MTVSDDLGVKRTVHHLFQLPARKIFKVGLNIYFLMIIVE